MGHHTITITLTLAAQRAAILCGLDGAKKQIYTVELADLPALLALPDHKVTPEGCAEWSGTYIDGGWLKLDERPRDGGHAVSLVQAALDARRQADASKVAEAEARRVASDAAQAARVADLTARLGDAAVDLSRQRGPLAYAVCTDVQAHTWILVGRTEYPYGQPWERLPALDARVAEALRLDDAIRASDAAAKGDLAEDRLRKLASIASEHGDATVRGRLDAAPGPLGLLPEGEALRLATDSRLPVSDVLREYVLLDSEDVCAHCDEDSCQEVDPSYLTEEPATLTADEWRAVQSTRSALRSAGLPEGKLRWHKGQCDRQFCPAWPVSRLGIMVELDLGYGLVVKREYAVAVAS